MNVECNGIESPSSLERKNYCPDFTQAETYVFVSHPGPHSGLKTLNETSGVGNYSGSLDEATGE